MLQKLRFPSFLSHAEAWCKRYNPQCSIRNSRKRNFRVLKHQKVRFVKRFQFKSKTLVNSEMQNSTTVLLHFTSSDLPDMVTIGYMTFKTSLYIHRPLRCYKCNRFGHVASKCKNKDRCSQCGGDHPRSSCNQPVKNALIVGETTLLLTGPVLGTKRRPRLLKLKSLVKFRMPKLAKEQKYLFRLNRHAKNLQIQTKIC